MKRPMRMLGRRMTALLASMVLLAGVLPVQAAGLQMPAAKKAQMEVPSDWLSVNVYSSLKDVKVTVTYDGYLGSLKASDLGLKGDGEVPVLKEGSHIQFQIQHKNPMTYYNFCYDGIVLPEDAQPMGWDGCGGGQIYYGSDSEGSFSSRFMEQERKITAPPRPPVLSTWKSSALIWEMASTPIRR